MSYNSNGAFTAGKCLNAIIDLTDIKGGDYSAAKKRSKLGYLDAINSPLNRTPQSQIPTQMGTKKRVVEIRWRQRSVEGEVEQTASGTCTSETYPDFNAELFEVDKVVETKFALDTSEFQAVCEGRSKFINDTIQLKFDAMARVINGVLLEEQNLNFGINIATATSAATDLTVYPAITGLPNAAPLQTLLYDYNLANEMAGNPIIVSGGNSYKYLITLKAGCCNDGGVNMLDFSNQLGYANFVDTMLDAKLGANNFIVMEPQSVQMVHFNDYTGEDATNAGSSVSRGTITDTKTGITYDIKILQNDCDDNWTVILRLHYGIFFQPGEAYQADDHLYGTNGTLRYRAITS